MPAHKFDSTSASAAVKTRWDAVSASEGEIRKRFKEELTVDEGLEELAKVRKMCEIASSELNQRMNAEGEKCAICGRVLDGLTRPTMIEPFRDEATGVLFNKYYCSVICVQQRNRKKLGLEALVK